jgi:predicted transcriptional regulator YheO
MKRQIDRQSENKRQAQKKTSEAFLFEPLKIIVDGIARTFGSRCEVVLHDLSDLDRSIVKIANSHVTGRTVGGGITDQGLKFIKSNQQDDLLINYPSMTKDGRPLKSSTIIFRNDKRRPYAAICINFDVTDILNLNTAIQDIFTVSEETQGKRPVETFESDIVSTLNEIADKTIRKTGKAVPSMRREDKIEIVRRLEDQGVFLIKGAIKLIARKLNVSKFTIYNYLDHVRAETR